MQYIDKRIVPIFKTVISKSKSPPIIILMGDTGLENLNRRTDLLAYYLPRNGRAKLYPNISPVNSFRLIFDEYFGVNYPLWPDKTYIKDTLTAPDAYPDRARYFAYEALYQWWLPIEILSAILISFSR